MIACGFARDYIWQHEGFQRAIFGKMWVGKGVFLATRLL
jgi:hypothetical protein